MSSSFNKVKVGTAVCDITPPVGCEMSGSVRPIVSTGLRTPLKARAMAIAAGGRTLVFCAVDLISLYVEHVANIKRLVFERTGIPGEALMIGATHTHNGPVLVPQFAGQRPMDGEWVRRMEAKISDAIAEAAAGLRPARIGIARGEEPGLVFNRRLRRPDGRIAMNFTGKADLQSCTAPGLVDPSLAVIRADDLAGNPIGILFNYPNHNNAAGIRELCADWSGFAEEELRERLGADVPVLFFPGASADLNWVDYRNLQQTGGLAEARRIASVLAEAIGQVCSAMTMTDDMELDCQLMPVELRERGLQPVDLDDDGCFGAAAGSFADFYREARDQLLGGRPLARHRYELAAFRLGDTVWVSNPAELFVELGLNIKALSPFGAERTHICSLTNGYAGYVPTEEAFAEGGYEVRRSLGSSFLQTDAGTIFVEKSIELANRLRSGSSSAGRG